MKPKLFLSIFTLVTLLLLNGQSRADVISINFADSARTKMRPADTAGVVPVGNWNNVRRSKTVSNLIDSQGQATNVAVTAEAGVFLSNDNDGPDDYKMMNAWAGFDETDGGVSITGLPTAFTEPGYHVYVYFDSNMQMEDPATMSFTIDSTTIFGMEEFIFQGTYTEATGVTDEFATMGNYVVFTGLKEEGFFLKADCNHLRASICGIQIVTVTPVAVDPSPENAVNYVPVDALLSWNVDYVTGFTPTYNVYLGTDPDNLPLKSYMQPQTVYDPVPDMVPGTAYYWRIDVVDTPVVYAGSTWTFTSYQSPQKTVEWRLEGADRIEDLLYEGRTYEQTILLEHINADSSSNTYGHAFNTVSGMGLSDAFLHDDSSQTVWCTDIGGGGITNPSPATEIGSAWIAYTFDKVYDLGTMWVWNLNDAENTDSGLKNVYIEYSTDGLNWTALGGDEYFHKFAHATGLENYAHNTEIDFGGVPARHVVITTRDDNGNGNYGGEYYGLSEIRFGVAGTTESLIFTADETENNNEGLVVNSPVPDGPDWTAGLDGISLQLAGTDDAVVDTNAQSLPLELMDHWTMNLYLFIDQQPADWTRIAAVGDQAMRDLIVSEDGQVAFFYKGRYLLNSPETLDIGNWQMLTVTCDYEYLKIYKDGVEVASKTLPFTELDEDPQMILRVWSRLETFAGKVDGFIVFNGALQQPDIDLLAAALP